MVIVVILIREAFYYVWYLSVKQESDIYIYILDSLSLLNLPLRIPIQIIRILDASSYTWREKLIMAAKTSSTT